MKPTLPTLLLAATLCASALAMRPARAQDDYSFPGYDFNTLSGMAAMDGVRQEIWRQESDRLQRDAQQSASPRGQGVRKTKPKKTPLKKALTTTTYRESPTVHKQVLGKFTQHLRTQITSKADAENMCRDFEGQDVMALWAKDVAKDGLKRGDVADAMANYWIMDWRIANRVMTDPTRVQVQAVRRFFASILSSTPAFAKATGAQRQEMAEAYIYTAVLQGGLFAQVFHTGNKALIQKVSDGQNAQFKKETGIDLRLMKLTNAGFAAKS